MSRRGSDLPGNRARISRVPIEAPRTTARSKDKRPASPSRAISGVVGGILLVAGIVGLLWLLTHQRPLLPLPGLAPTQPLAVQIPSLLAAGITLGHPTHQPALNRQQVLLIASELEPDAASNAASASTQYVLLNYANKSTTHPNLNNYPAWMILYQNIPLAPSDVSVDPTPVPQSHHDLYVFLDATSGKELLAIWVD